MEYCSDTSLCKGRQSHILHGVNYVALRVPIAHVRVRGSLMPNRFLLRFSISSCFGFSSSPTPAIHSLVAYPCWLLLLGCWPCYEILYLFNQRASQASACSAWCFETADLPVCFCCQFIYQGRQGVQAWDSAATLRYTTLNIGSLILDFTACK